MPLAFPAALSCPPATAKRLGGVKVGPGLNVGEDGTLSVNMAGDEDVTKMLGKVFGQG